MGHAVFGTRTKASDSGGQSLSHSLAATPRGDEESACAHKLDDSQLPRKAPVELTAVVTVPQTDTGGWGEYPKALERTFVKELCKLIP